MLETERLILRPWTYEDHESLHRILSDPVTMQFWPAPFTPEQTRGWISNILAHYATHGYGRMAVVLRASGAIIGDCGVMNLEINGRPEHDLGYIIHHPYWRQGYAVEAASACLSHSIDTLGLTRVVANMAVDHTGSMRVAERLGMRRERTFANPRNRGIMTHLYVFECDRPSQTGSSER
jgi:[ribosomal protein S5]-alanine N-acetyltransferase